MRRFVLIALVTVVLALGAVVSAQSLSHLPTVFPFQLLNYAPLSTGQIQERYSVAIVGDGSAGETCLAIVVDTQTGAFTATAVPVASCEARRP